MKKALADARSANESLQLRLKTLQDLAASRLREVELLRKECEELQARIEHLSKVDEAEEVNTLILAVAIATTQKEASKALVNIISSPVAKLISIKVLTAAAKAAEGTIGHDKWPSFFFQDTIQFLTAVKKCK